ncbi:hypothetical protein VM95_24795, partial [Streptomyces rubellomurinus]
MTTHLDHAWPIAERAPAETFAHGDETAGAPTVELPAVAEPVVAEPVVAEPAEPAPPPVFVDESGRRQRRMRRLGAVAAVPAGGYLVLLASTLLGGPTVNAPFLPLPQPAAPSAPAPAAAPSDAPSAAPEAAA